MSGSVGAYLNLITSEHSNQPNYTATVTASVQPFADAQLVASALDATSFDLDVAVGVQLDAVGVRIGISRYIQTEVSGGFFSWDTPNLGWEQGYWQGEFGVVSSVTALDDTTYRAVLRTKIQANNWDGTNANVGLLIPTALLPVGTIADVLDNQNMSMTIRIRGLAPPPVVAAIIVGGYIPLKPVGVQLTYAIMPTAGTTGLPFYLPNQVPH